GSAELPPGASRVEFTLTATAGGTRLDLVHSGLPDVQADRHATGWAHFLSRLAAAAAGADPGPDPWAAPTVAGPGAAPGQGTGAQWRRGDCDRRFVGFPRTAPGHRPDRSGPRGGTARAPPAP